VNESPLTTERVGDKTLRVSMVPPDELLNTATSEIVSVVDIENVLDHCVVSLLDVVVVRVTVAAALWLSVTNAVCVAAAAVVPVP